MLRFHPGGQPPPAGNPQGGAAAFTAEGLGAINQRDHAQCGNDNHRDFAKGIPGAQVHQQDVDSIGTVSNLFGQIRHELGDGLGLTRVNSKHRYYGDGKTRAHGKPGTQAAHLGVLLPFGGGRHAAQNQHEKNHHDGLGQQLRQRQVRRTVQSEDEGERIASHPDDDDG